MQARLTVSLYLFTIERLDDGDALDDVQDALTHSLMSAEDTPSSALHPFCLKVGYIKIYRYDTQSDQPHIDIRPKHQNKRQDGTCEERQDFNEEIVDGIRQTHDASVDSRLQFSRFIPFGCKECHTEGKHALHHPQRKVTTHKDTHPFTIISLEECHQRSNHFFAKKDDSNRGQDLNCAGPREVWYLYECIDCIDSTVEHNGIHLCHQRTDDCQCQCNAHQPPVRQYEGQDILQQVQDIHLPCILLTIVHLLFFSFCRQRYNKYFKKSFISYIISTMNDFSYQMKHKL